MKKPPPASSAPPPVGVPPADASLPVSSSPQGSTLPPSSLPSARPRQNEVEADNPYPPAIPDHQLLKRIGGGSYGEVWLARNALGAHRAVKIVHRHTFDHDRPFEREFAGIQKVEPISRSHEGLVDLLQVGRNDAEGYFYYVMELADDADADPKPEDRGPKEIRGPNSERDTGPIRSSVIGFPSDFGIRNSDLYLPRTLRHDLKTRGRLPLNECIELGLSLANALSYLHEQGLVHRDIKPSNIIFLGGVPKLADVGLVTGVDEARSFVGTEGFIPPEGPGTPQADIYSLGIVLYQMSTGKNPQDFPEPLPDLAAQPDHARWLEFNAVIHKACVANPRARYQSAAEMRAELELLQRGQSVKHKRAAQRRSGLAWKTTIAVTTIAVTAAIGWQVYSGIALRRLSAPITRPVVPLNDLKVVAVLPFDDQSEGQTAGDFATQVTKELTTSLSRFSTFRVLDRDSAAALKNARYSRTAPQSKVTALLSGSVGQYGNQIRLAAQLRNPDDGHVLWSDACDGEMKHRINPLNRLAAGVVWKVTGRLTLNDRTLLASNATTNAEAYRLYRQAWDFGAPAQAKKLFQKAIDLDPELAGAYAGLARCFLVESQTHGSPKEVIQAALAAAEKSVGLDGTLAEAREALGRARNHLYDWEGARKELEEAVRLDPHLTSARSQYARYLRSQGRFKEAIEQSRAAVETDPGSEALVMGLCWTLLDARRYDEAEKALEGARNLNPQLSEDLAWCYLAQGHDDKAVGLWTRRWRTSTTEAALLQAYKKQGMQGYWRKTLEQSLEQLRGGANMDSYWLAADYAKAGDNDHAFEWLERAYERYNVLMPLVAVEYRLNNLHSDPRFDALLKKLGLPMPKD